MANRPAAESTFVSNGAVRLRVIHRGAGRDHLLVLPGITSPAAVWGFAVEGLAGGRQVHTLDLRGRGCSDAPEQGYLLEDYAADALAVIRGLGFARPAVLGHSLGARIAAALAVSAPDEVGRLVLVEPPLTGPGRPPYPFPLEQYLEDIEAARRAPPSEGVGPAHWTEEQRRERTEALRSCDENAIRETYANFHREDFLRLWAELRDPALICGAESPVIPSTALDELQRLNPTARVQVVPGAGHMVPWDNLPGFRAAVEAALHSPGPARA